MSTFTVCCKKAVFFSEMECPDHNPSRQSLHNEISSLKAQVKELDWKSLKRKCVTKKVGGIDVTNPSAVDTMIDAMKAQKDYIASLKTKLGKAREALTRIMETDYDKTAEWCSDTASDALEQIGEEE